MLAGVPSIDVIIAKRLDYCQLGVTILVRHHTELIILIVFNQRDNFSWSNSIHWVARNRKLEVIVRNDRLNPPLLTVEDVSVRLPSAIVVATEDKDLVITKWRHQSATTWL